MRHRDRFLEIWLLPGLALAVGFVPRGDEESPPDRPFGVERRVPWTTSRLVGSPEPPPPFRLDRVFPHIAFQGPVCIAQEPGANRLWVAENRGKVFSLSIDDPDVREPDLVLDLSAERTIYAFSYHPAYEENGEIFIFSPTPMDGSAESAMSRVSRFRVDPDGSGTVLRDSEQVIIEWPAGGHNGGEAIFGPDGYLYIGTGDGSGGSDVDDTGQGVDDLLSVIMRIDVDRPDPGRNYAIPHDNPFVEHPGARPEIWAFGFRNPWRMSFDPETGRLWVGDVGQDLWEMIWEVRKGGNYGWSVQEGSHPFHPHKRAGPGPILPPVVEHHHAECRSITGGYVYHGDRFPELRGAYIYGDYQYGKIWGLRDEGRHVTWHDELADTAVFIASFAVTRDGEILAVDNTTGFIHALRRSSPGTASATFPRTLGETGLFASVPDQEPAPGVIPYSVNAPQWADGALADRLLALPDDAQISDADSWGYPDGMVAVQTLSLDLEAGEPSSRTPIETRILLKQDDHWMGYSYLWDDARSEATLVGRDGAERLLSVADPAAPGGIRQQTWRVPAREECMFCHSRAAGFVLGLKTSQLNRQHDYGGVADNQLRALDHIGIFKAPLASDPGSLPRFVDPYDEHADLDDRARTYLHVNCSICHVADGGGNSFIELDRGRSLEDTRLVGGSPVQGTFGISDARIVAPGEPGRSVLYYRIASLGGARMPRIGSRMVDEEALDLIYRWIAQLPGADDQAEHAGLAALVEPLLDASGSAEPSRAEAIRRLISSTSGAIALTRAIDLGTVPEAVRLEILEATRSHPAPEVRDLFERFVPEADRVRRLGERIDPGEILALQGDADRGRAIFAAESAVNCKSCHRLGGIGVEIGPDLGRIGEKYPRAELLRQIIEPSLVIEPNYALYLVATKSGGIHSGLLIADDGAGVVLRDAQGQEIRIDSSEVEEIRTQPDSLMPELLLRGLTAQEAADLLEYLSSLR
ncbi:PQQ-dependent sugar dehydrogenase [Tautonia plasticadhaerens]|uniref:Soluble aldose sugar dehydrogenase YliI n=1 Tax=Tautonia plasticadhaerens TaxID=2527974 RepID=A0A518H6U4_9BACT|nr:PQQ-dependent sugar dehydrogenase [Tautonia plasticadhaerens]QDV36538.1 Soluble aldose sugar dehydrogenase YliI precursor [Tautonia plasticadhaerens]